MMKELREYFRTFGNPDFPEADYWEQDPNLIQVILGVLVAPAVIVIWLLIKLFSIKIRL